MKYLIDFSHNVIESIFIRSRFLLELIFIKTQHGHHELINVLKRNVQWVGLVLKVEVNHLNNFLLVPAPFLRFYID